MADDFQGRRRGAAHQRQGQRHPAPLLAGRPRARIHLRPHRQAPGLGPAPGGRRAASGHRHVERRRRRRLVTRREAAPPARRLRREAFPGGQGRRPDRAPHPRLHVAHGRRGDQGRAHQRVDHRPRGRQAGAPDRAHLQRRSGGLVAGRQARRLQRRHARERSAGRDQLPMDAGCRWEVGAAPHRFSQERNPQRRLGSLQAHRVPGRRQAGLARMG